MEKNKTTIRDYLRIIFRRKVILIITVIPVLIINYVIYEFTSTPIYTASVKMLLKGEQKTEAEYYSQVRSHTEKMIWSHGEMLSSTYVLERVVRALKLYELPYDREKYFSKPLKRTWLEYAATKRESPTGRSLNEQETRIIRAIQTLKGKIGITPLMGSDLFYINAKDYDPSLAVKIANSLSRSYTIFDLEQQISELELKYGDKHSTVVQLENHVASLMDTLDGRYTSALEAIGPATIKIMEQAQVSPVERKTLFNILIFALFAGIILGLIIIVLIDHFDQTIKSPRDVESALDISLIGSVPKIKSKNKLISNSTADSSYVRAYKHLSDNILVMLKNHQFKSILVTDVDDSEGAANIISNIGIYLSHYEGHRVLIIDVNLRSPIMSDIFNISNNGNIIDVLEGRISYVEAIKDAGLNLNVLPASMPLTNPIGYLDSKNFTDLIDKVKDNYDLILICCADLKSFTDAVILSSFVDGTIIVVNEGRTHQQVTKFNVQPLKLKKVNILGAILNNRTYEIPNIIYKLT